MPNTNLVTARVSKQLLGLICRRPRPQTRLQATCVPAVWCLERRHDLLSIIYCVYSSKGRRIIVDRIPRFVTSLLWRLHQNPTYHRPCPSPCNLSMFMDRAWHMLIRLMPSVQSPPQSSFMAIRHRRTFGGTSSRISPPSSDALLPT